jgi:UDP-glucose 4-epimerase
MQTKKSETLLVTGGAGFVGSHLIAKLLAHYPEAQIISLDNYFTGQISNHVQSERVSYVVGNTQDIYQIWEQQELPIPDAVFHLGEYSRIWQSFDDFEQVWDSNLRGTKEVVRFSHMHSCKLVYAGSSSKFGNDGLDQNLSPYAWIKAKNVEFIKNFHGWFGLDYVVTYFYNVYGPRHIKEGRYATVIGIFESLYEKGEQLPVREPGTQTRDFTHVEDVAEGIILCFEKGQGDGYQLGTGQEHSLIQLAEMFGGNYVLIPPRKGERLHGKADLKKIRSLGWEPKHSLADYIEDFKKSL